MRKGSLQVTNARLPDSFYTIRWVPLNTLISSGSKAKSFNASSRVVIKAIVTLREMTGGIMS